MVIDMHIDPCYSTGEIAFKAAILWDSNGTASLSNYLSVGLCDFAPLPLPGKNIIPYKSKYSIREFLECEKGIVVLCFLKVLPVEYSFFLYESPYLSFIITRSVYRSNAFDRECLFLVHILATGKVNNKAAKIGWSVTCSHIWDHSRQYS